MFLLRWTTALSFAALLALVTAAASSARSPRVTSSTAKAARIHLHFDSVLRELDSRDIAGLSSDRRARRTMLTATLRAYDARGLFPNNYDFAQPTPYFVDRKTGARCAVAHLLESTGRADIVRRVAKADVNVRVATLSSDTAFTAWLDAQGITLEEAVRIQPTYEGENGSVTIREAALIAGGGLAIVGTAVGTSIWNAGGNANGHSQLGNVLGVTSGVLTAIIGAAIARSSEGMIERSLGTATAAAGGVSIVLGARGFSRRSRARSAAQQGLREQAHAGSTRAATIVPIIAMGRNTTAGVAMLIRF